MCVRPVFIFVPSHWCNSLTAFLFERSVPAATGMQFLRELPLPDSWRGRLVRSGKQPMSIRRRWGSPACHLAPSQIQLTLSPSLLSPARPRAILVRWPFRLLNLAIMLLNWCQGWHLPERGRSSQSGRSGYRMRPRWERPTFLVSPLCFPLDHTHTSLLSSLSCFSLGFLHLL